MTSVTMPAPTTTTAAASERGEGLQLAVVMLQLAMVCLLVRYFRIEGHAFADRLMLLAAIGFLPHHLIPPRHRLGFFVALSLAGIGWILGLPGLWLIGSVLVMVGACHLPVPYWWRVTVVAGLGVVLLLMRSGRLPTPWPNAIWPILASILMFRLIAYLYDLRHSKTPIGIGDTLAYFFLLPNVAFPLFPVVDFSTFRRTYYDRRPVEIYQEGVQWILRGILQLLVYRFVYQFLLIGQTDVVSTASLVRYLVANFGLYLRVSGSFHLIVGLLHLYGFRLPETHRLFYLAPSFTELWRRINIYWKDFMQKVVFAPAFYPLRRRVGDTWALTLATATVFFATWALHAYQWYWILGHKQISWTDSLFWGILGLILVITSHRELRRGRTRPLTRSTVTRFEWRAATRTLLGIAGTFGVLCALWGLWNSRTVPEFLHIFTVIRPTVRDAALLLSVPLFMGIVGVGADLILPRYLQRTASAPCLRFSVALAPLALLAVLTQPKVAGALGGRAHRLAYNLRSNQLNRQDEKAQQAGYYDELMQVDRFNPELQRLYSQKPADWLRIDPSGARRDTASFLLHVMVPSRSSRVAGATMTTNSFGMRDQQYTIAKPPGTWRIALLGKSHVLGEGVADDSTFEAMLERHLNATLPSGAPRIEILNFAVSGYHPLQQADLLESERVFEFAPDVVLYVGHASDLNTIYDLENALIQSVPIPWDSMRSLLASAGAAKGQSPAQLERELLPHAPAALDFAYQRIVELTRAHGAIPAWAYVPLPLEHGDDRPFVTARARDAGFAVVDIPDMFIGHDESDLTIAPWDAHPNAAGHHIIADRLYDALQRLPALLGRAAPAGAAH